MNIADTKTPGLVTSGYPGDKPAAAEHAPNRANDRLPWLKGEAAGSRKHYTLLPLDDCLYTLQPDS